MSKTKIVRDDRLAITAVKKIILSKPEAKYSIHSLTTFTSFNRDKLARLFKAMYGVSIHQYIINIRIRKAMKLLYDRDKSIKAVAIECGYKNPKNFSTAFRKSTGVTPSDYQRAKRK